MMKTQSYQFSVYFRMVNMDFMISLPECQLLLTVNGIREVFNLNISKEEQEQLTKSVSILKETLDTVSLKKSGMSFLM